MGEASSNNIRVRPTAAAAVAAAHVFVAQFSRLRNATAWPRVLLLVLFPPRTARPADRRRRRHTRRMRSSPLRRQVNKFNYYLLLQRYRDNRSPFNILKGPAIGRFSKSPHRLKIRYYNCKVVASPPSRVPVSSTWTSRAPWRRLPKRGWSPAPKARLPIRRSTDSRSVLLLLFRPRRIYYNIEFPKTLVICFFL